VSRRSLVAFLGLALMLTPGCGGGGAPAPTAGAAAAAGGGAGEKAPRIALVMKSLANEFFKTMADGATTHQAESRGQYTLVVNGIKDERDLAEQVRIMDQMIAEKVDAIVLAPADSKALVAACKRARDAGIVVVNIDNRLDADVLKAEGLAIPFVGPDNREGARKVGEFVASRLRPGDAVAIVEGIPTAYNGQQRKLGFEDAAKAANLKLVGSQSAHWEMAEANKVAAAMLAEHPDLKALLCCNDSMALGALAAVNAAGKKGQVLIGGFDHIGAVKQALEEGGILATADQFGDQLAVFGIEYALKLLRDPTATPKDRETPVDLILKTPPAPKI
jgi:ribose transport system substrate-binding protein